MMALEDSPSSYFPQEIIFAILLRLSFQSLLVCKLVSKEWYNLIKDPEFSKLYRDKSMAICIKGRRVCRLSFSHLSKLKRYPYYVAETLLLFNVDCFYGAPKLLSGSSDIIACIKTAGGVVIYRNLLTGASYTVSDAPRRNERLVGWLCFGFGYDPYDEEYKLLIVCRYGSGFVLRKLCERIGREIADQNEDTSLFWVYSFTKHDWKSFNGFPYAELLWSPNQPGAHSFSGFLHWVLYSRSFDADPENPKFLIVTYDLHTCTFGEMSAPNGYSHGHAMVSELDGSLSLLYENELQFELWVMKVYGIGESWTNLFRFNPSVMRNYFDIFMVAYMAPYECEDGRNGVMFVSHNDKRLYWYDITNNKLHYSTWRVRMSRLMEMPRRRIESYMQSF